MINVEDNICLLCGNLRKSISHIFLLYQQINNIWYQVANLHEMSFVCPNNIIAMFEYWINVGFLIHRIQPWHLPFYALTWTISKMPNKVIFCNETFDSSTCFDLFRYHFDCWSWNAWGVSLPTLFDFCYALACDCPLTCYSSSV